MSIKERVWSIKERVWSINPNPRLLVKITKTTEITKVTLITEITPPPYSFIPLSVCWFIYFSIWSV